MADLDVTNPFRISDKRNGRGNTSTTLLTEAANMTSISAMRARLTAINGAYYTSTRLNNMTENDMVYALRDTSSI